MRNLLRNQDLKEVRDPASHAGSLEIGISFELLPATYKEASNCLLGWLSIRADKLNDAGQEATVKQQEGQAPTERGRETLIQGRVTNCPTLPARDEHAATLPPGCPRSLVRRNVSRRRPGPAGHLPSGP